MHVDTTLRTINFLIDGEDFFQSLHKNILQTEIDSRISFEANAVAAAAARLSIRFAYWKADPDVILPAVTVHGTSRGPRRLFDALTSACAEGVDVKILLWNAWKTECWFPGSRFDKRVRTLASQPKTAREGTFEIKKHNYRGYLLHPATSLHLKIAVFERTGDPIALLGGLNLGESYKSNKVHDQDNNWHDAALQLQGEAVKVLRTFCNGLWADNLPPQHNNAAQRREGERYAVEVLTTDMRWPRAERDIRSRLIEKINLATKYVYLENQALTDPAIIDALISAAARGVQMICVVPHPKQTMLGDYSGYAYVMGFAFRAIALAGMRSFIYPARLFGSWTIRAEELNSAELLYQGWLTADRILDVTNTRYRNHGENMQHRAAANRAAVVATCNRLRDGTDALYHNVNHPLLPFRPASQYMNRFIRWRGQGASGTGSVYLSKIMSIDSSTNSFYSPLLPAHDGKSPYVHSKIALIDDKWGFVGTSNWTYRSMQFDAEMSLHINNRDKVTQIREALFEHWGMGGLDMLSNPSSWADKARSTARNLERNLGGLNRNRVHIVPLTLADFDTSMFSVAATGAWAMGNQI